MKVSLNWVKEYTDVKLSVDELVEKIGAQLGGVDEVVDLGKKYQGIIIAKVVTCEKHPNADKLSICTIDDGGKAKHVKRNSKGHIEVVCGAPNVRPTLQVAWIPPGVAVPSTIDKDPLILEAREIRGVVSNGMLASASELGLSDDHSGIVELEEGKAGDDFAKTYGLDDYIIDIENKMFTHRPDLFGILGVAREIAGIDHKAFKSPDWYVKENSLSVLRDESVKSLSVDNQIPKLCPRYMAVTVSNVKVAPSPIWLQAHLSSVGIRPINNVVDMTNYMMMLTGQPLHAFDFDKIANDGKATIVVRNPKRSEEMTLLDGKTIKPRSDAILICDREKPIALGGVMGGNNSEIDENTTRIIIECANFDMYNIRRTAMEHGIFTDAVTRFNKGQSPWQCPPVLFKAVQLLQEICPDAKPSSKVVDSKHIKKANERVAVDAGFINARLGTKLSPSDMVKLLENVEFKTFKPPAGKGHIYMQPPFWRTDIEIPEDIVEEVGRLYGYDHLPLELPKRTIKPTEQDPMLELKNKIRGLLAEAGANEVLTYTFVHGNLMEKAGQDSGNAFQLSNALSPDLQYYRMSLLPSLLDKIHPNIKAGYSEFALFEMNPVHAKDLMKDDLPVEDKRLAYVFAAEDKIAKEKYSGAPYYQAKKYLVNLLADLGVTNLVFEPATEYEPKQGISKAAIAPFERGRSAIVKTTDGQFIGELGEFTTSVRRNLKLPDFVAGFELDVVKLLELSGKSSSYVPLPRFPKVEQDISLKVPLGVTYRELFDFIWEELGKIQPENTFPTLGPVDIYQPEGDTQHKHITLRLNLASYERTLTAEEVNKLLDNVADAAKEKFGAERL
jgi:phenylalanyl-tRNA synthetase beta chain